MILLASIIIQKTFSSASVAGLDVAVNSYIGHQTLDSRSIYRGVLFHSSFVSGATFYATLIIEETQLS